MNAKFKFIAVILAVATLASCGKITPTGGGSNEGGTEQGGGNTDPGTVPDTPLREISVAFNTKSTRTYLDEGGKPEFKIGDYIKVAQANGGAAVKEYQIEEIHGGKLGFKTDLQGALVAVYPAGNALENNDHTQITGVSVPSVQSGLFKDANICMADQSKESPQNLNHLQFHNQTALFAVKVPKNTAYIEVTSLGIASSVIPNNDNFPHYYHDDSRRNVINTDGSNPYLITVKDKNNDWGLNNSELTDIDDYGTDTYYVSVLTGLDFYSIENTNVSLVNLNFDVLSLPAGDVNFSHTYSDADLLHQMGGLSPKLVKKYLDVQACTLTPGQRAQAGDLYYLPNDSLHEYIIVDGLKWATMNIGAAATADSGYYFSWADYEGQEYKNDKWVNMKEYGTEGFYDNNGPYKGGSGYDRYDDYEIELDIFDDAAFVIWGGAWRVPTTNDFAVLCARNDLGGLTFPAAGYGELDEVIDFDIKSYYWTSNLYESDYDNAMIKSFSDNSLSKARYYGLPIRPVSGVAASDPTTIVHDPLNPGGNL